MSRAAWKATRARELKAAGYRCANRCVGGSALLDVVRMGAETSYLVVLCRSCRLKRDARARCAKAAATRKARAAQMKMFQKGAAA